MVLSVAASGWFLSGKAMEPVSLTNALNNLLPTLPTNSSPITLIQTDVQVALTDPEPELQLHRQQLSGGTANSATGSFSR